MPAPTPTQARYLAVIHVYLESFGRSPEEADIAKALGVKPPAVRQMLKTLEQKKFIRRKPGVHPTIELRIPAGDLPKWSKVVATTFLAGASGSEAKTRRAKASQVYQLKITLLGITPRIWRRIETLDVKLEELHELIQTSMGWTNSHLHQFQIGEELYTHPRFRSDAIEDLGAIDYSRIRLSDLVREHGPKLKMYYEYDFGDGWAHSVVLEKVNNPEARQRYPRCTDGARACPPEDVGGIYGFAEYLRAIRDPKHPDREYYLEWSGQFHPAEFDPAEATRAMRRGLPSW